MVRRTDFRENIRCDMGLAGRMRGWRVPPGSKADLPANIHLPETRAKIACGGGDCD